MIRLTDLLNESSPGFENRKTGDALPTLDSVRAAYQAKKGITEAEDDKYVSIGFGRYKEKGKEDDENSPTFKKDDSGKYVSTSDKAAKGGDSSAGKKDTPKVNIFDKPKSSDDKIKTIKKISPKADTDALKKLAKVGEPKSSEPSSKELTKKSVDVSLAKGADTFNNFLDDNESKFSKKDLKDLKKQTGSIKNLESELADAERKGDKEKILDLESDISFAKSNIKNQIYDMADEYAKDPKKDDGPQKDSTGGRAGNVEVNKSVRLKTKRMGITPKNLGKEEYERRMSQAAVEALTDANFHSEARALIAVLEDNPDFAKDPRQDPNMPDIMSPEYDKWRKSSVYGSEYYDSSPGTDEIGQHASQEAGWDGRDALDAIAFDLKLNGSKKLALKMQSVIDDTNESTMRLTKMEIRK